MAADWEQVFAGLVGAVGEVPENVKVLGAANGSVTLTLSATPIVTKLLALITKDATDIIQYIISVRLKLEELRQAKMITAKIESEFKEMETTKQKEGKDKIIAAINKMCPNLEPEFLTKLNISIDKILVFSEEGGEVDIPVPDTPAVDGDRKAVHKEIKEIRTLIMELQKVKQEIKLLDRE